MYAYIMGKGGFCVKGNWKGKAGRWKKSVAGGLICALLLAAGFMGIESFAPEERSITIIDEASVVSSPAVSGETDESGETGEGKDSAESEDDEDIGEGEGGDGAEEELETVSGESSEPEIEAKAAILIDGNSGSVLFAQNEKEHLPPASVTKVMTLLLIFEACDSGEISLDDEVTISENAAGMGGSQMYMEAGEQHTVEELIKGVIMVSANDGCVALAEHLAGSVEDFVARMNDRAFEMGLEDSNFVNTNGLPVADHYSCAYDIGMISVELMKFENARQWFTAWQEDIEVGLPGKESTFTLTNTNKLIKSYSGAIGVKTGFTQDAGYCLSGAAERESTRFIGVVLGCESSAIRFDAMETLLDYGFANYETIEIAGEGEKMGEIKVEKGEDTKLYAVTDEALKITVKKGDADSIETETEINGSVSLPVKKGDKVGTLTVSNGEETVYECNLVSDRNVAKADFLTTYIRMIKKLI